MELLNIIFLGGGLGIAGQMIRAIVGIKKQLSRKSKKKWFDGKRFIISLIVGFVAGLIAAIILSGDPITKSTIISLIAAGYAGTDFIEGIFRKHNDRTNTKT